jgi:hypothetical protein
MSEKFLRASLRLWRWRLHRHKAKAAAFHAQVVKDKAQIGVRLKQLADLKPAGHLDWMPGAVVHKASASGTPWQVDCQPRGVLHTTESLVDATGTLDAKRAWPHFQVERSGRITQYYPLVIGARALEHVGDPPTNGAHCFQIEVCAMAADPKWPEVQKVAVRKVMRFIETNGGVARECNVEFTDSQHVKRLTGAAWLALRGWCGHQHVPNQPSGHWDPGKINMKELL